MHLFVPFASDISEACRHVLHGLALPNLGRLLGRLSPLPRDDAEPTTLSPPHERALAAAWHWRGADGLWPFAAQSATVDGIAVGDRSWGLLSPAHWQLGRDHVVMTDPMQLALGDAESRALFDAVRGLFESEGFAASYGDAARWYVAHDDLATLATASIDRVIGRSVDDWLGSGAAPARQRIRRLQSEVQLVFYTHAVNEAREHRGELAVNSFWLSGCGRMQPSTVAAPADEPTIERSLRAPLLAGDWAAWAEAWQALDLGPLAALAARLDGDAPVALTLCGERAAAPFERRPRSLWQGLKASWSTVDPQALLATL